MSPPWKFQEIFPARLVVKKMGKKRRFARCLPHENFWKLTGMIDQWPWNSVYVIVYGSTTKVIQIITLGWPCPILRQGFCMGKSENYLFFWMLNRWTDFEIISQELALGDCLPKVL